MKRYLSYITVSSLLLFSCNNEIEQSNQSLDSAGRVPISLSVYDADMTRSEVNTTSIDNMSNGFVVIIMTEKDGELETVVDNEPVTYNASNDSFEFWGGATYFWPEDENQPVYIYAYGTHSSVNDEGVEVQYPGLINEWDSDWTEIYQFAEGNLEDHLFAPYSREFSHDMVHYTATLTRKDNGNTINMVFKHSTAKLNFKFRTDAEGYAYQMKSFKVYTNYDALFDLTSQTPCPDVYLGLRPLELIQGSEPQIASTSYISLVGIADYVIAFPDKVKLEFEYESTYMDGSSRTLTASAELAIQSGISYTYNITLSSTSDEIGVEVDEVEDWQDGGAKDEEISTPSTPDMTSAVDLGLPSGTLWHSENLEGLYYWGALQDGDGPYDGTESKLSLDRDAAHYKLGGNWSMPTLDQCKELVKNAYWTYVSQSASEQTGVKPGFYVFKDTEKLAEEDITPYYQDGTATKNSDVPYDIETDVYIHFALSHGDYGYYISNECEDTDVKCITVGISPYYLSTYDTRGRTLTGAIHPVWNP